jgi:hypothetical protein
MGTKHFRVRHQIIVELHAEVSEHLSRLRGVVRRHQRAKAVLNAQAFHDVPGGNLPRRTDNLFVGVDHSKVRLRQPQHLLDGLGVRVGLQPLRLNESTVQIKEHGTNHGDLFISMRQ